MYECKRMPEPIKSISLTLSGHAGVVGDGLQHNFKTSSGQATCVSNMKDLRDACGI